MIVKFEAKSFLIANFILYYLLIYLFKAFDFIVSVLMENIE